MGGVFLSPAGGVVPSCNAGSLLLNVRFIELEFWNHQSRKSGNALNVNASAHT